MEKLYSSIAERLKEVLFFAKKWGLATSQQHFGELLGYTDKAYVSSIFNGRKNPNDFILCVGDKFPFFNTEYIRSGQGKLIKEGYTSSNRNRLLESYLGTSPEPQDDIFSEVQEVQEDVKDTHTEEVPVAELPVLPAPLIDTPNISIWKEIQANQSQFEKINLLNLIRDVDVVYRVLSDMMTPNVAVGDLLFLKVLPNNIRVLNGECYFVDTRIFGGVVRYVFDEGDHYKLIAPNKAFADTEVAKEDVINIFQIRGRFSNRINRPDYMGNKQIKKQSQQITSLEDSVNNLVTATIDEGKRTDKVLQMLEKEIERNANK